MTDRIVPTDLVARAARTFAQAFVATITVTAAAGVQLTEAGIRSAVVGALAAGVSAAWNVVFGVPLIAENVTTPDTPSRLPEGSEPPQS
jgi:hypothetical protein